MNEADGDGVFAGGLACAYFVEEAADDAGGEAGVVGGLGAVHGVAFAGAGLSVGEDGAVVSLECFLDHVCHSALAEYFFLSGIFR